MRISLLLLLMGCSPSSSGSIVVDRPRAGEAIITGTRQTILWHGGNASDTVDVLFVPTGSGSAVTLAGAVPNNGKTEVVVHLVGDDQRGGGTITVRPTAKASGLGSSAQALGGDDPPSVSVGCLAGFEWNGASEDYFWMDVTTGEKTLLGTVGDLEAWNLFRPLAIDHAAGRIYIIGLRGVQQRLYVLDAKSGMLLQSGAAGGANSLSSLTMVGDRLLGFYYDTKEQMAEIDKTTGQLSVIGQVGDLESWSGQAAYDPVSGNMYVLGMATAGGWKLYSLNATTGVNGPTVALTLDGAPLDDLLGVVVDKKGELLGFRYDNATKKEQMLRVDPASGSAIVIGTVGDLTTWSLVAQINLTNDTIYVIGNDPSDKPTLYAMDASGAFLYQTALVSYPTQGVLVY